MNICSQAHTQQYRNSKPTNSNMDLYSKLQTWLSSKITTLFLEIQPLKCKINVKQNPKHKDILKLQ